MLLTIDLRRSPLGTAGVGGPRTLTGMKMLYEVLAENPGTPASLLSRLYLLAAGTRRADELSDRNDSRSLMCALARNPHLPDHVRTALDLDRDVPVRKAILERPGMTADLVMELLADESRVAVLRHAVRVVDDPAGDLARFAIERCRATWIFVDVIASTKASEDMRIFAADHLARSNKNLNGANVNRVVTVARRHPDLVVKLMRDSEVADPVKKQLVSIFVNMGFLDTDADEPASGQHPRKPADLTRWLANPHRTRDEVLAYVRQAPNERLARQVVVEYRDATGQVAAEALARSASRMVASAVLTCPEAGLDTRREAARRVAADKSGIGYANVHTIKELLTNPVFASEIAATALHRDLFWALLEQRDLSPAAVTALYQHLRRGNEQSEVRAPHATQWLWVATSPAATLEQRAAAAAEVTRDLAAKASSFPTDGSWMEAWAEAGVRAATEGAAAAVADVPCKAVRDVTSWCCLPGVAHLLTVALTEHLNVLDDDSAINVLTALAADFTGTVGELVDTAAAVTLAAH